MPLTPSAALPAMTVMMSEAERIAGFPDSRKDVWPQPPFSVIS